MTTQIKMVYGCLNILQLLRKLAEGHTVIILTHRCTTLMKILRKAIEMAKELLNCI